MSETKLPPTDRRSQLGTALLAVALIVFALIVWRSYFLIDDAFISFRYAKNWADGHGPVYNPGISAPVEGYSNFSWVALLTLGALAGASPVILSNVLSIAAATATVLLCYRFLTRRLELDGLSSGLATLALAALPCFGVWATGGLETALFGLLLFGCWYLLTANPDHAEVRRGALVGLLGIVLVLTRVEGFLWIAGLCLAAVVACRPSVPWKRLIIFVAVVAIGVLPHLFWRHSFYGEWVANTVQAKSGFSSLTLARGARSLATWGLLFLWPVLVLASPLLASTPRQRALGFSALVMASGTLVYNLAVGGDWMPMFRFMAPASAFFAILLGLGLARLKETPRVILGALALGFAVLPIFDISPIPRSLRESLYFRDFQIGYQSEWYRWATSDYNTLRNTWRGRALASVLRGDESWTGGAIGATGYYSGIYIHDRNGLVNREVARREIDAGTGTAGHEKRVPRAWFRDQSPTYYKIFVSPKPVPPQGPRFDEAVRTLMQVLFVDEKERPLTECSTVKVIPIKGIPPLPPDSALVVLEHEPNRRRARTFWSRYLQASGPKSNR